MVRDILLARNGKRRCVERAKDMPARSVSVKTIDISGGQCKFIYFTPPIPGPFLSRYVELANKLLPTPMPISDFNYAVPK
jgi:hypothetical protein